MSKLQDAETAYTFDDFVLVPMHSEIKSRKDPEINVSLPDFDFPLPIVAAPMNTVCEEDMLVAMCDMGATGVLHRYMSIEDQYNMCKNVMARLSDAVSDTPVLSWGPNCTQKFYAAVGAQGPQGDSSDRAAALMEAGVHGICIDVANGHNALCINTVRALRARWPTVNIMAGNVCTLAGARDLAAAGANSLRVGVGPGAVCTTRLVTGHGVPQLSAIEDCARIKEEYPNIALIADGGIRYSGDIVKALAIGADAIMIGSLLAGTIESPGEWLEENGQLFKYYHGMASVEGRKKWFDKSKAGLPSEGVSTKVPYTGRSAYRVVEGLCQSVKVGLSYAGARNLAELREKAVWRRVTAAGVTEGTPHGKR
ncbi:MAG: guanosine monophosphate reductase [Patescibacteria group bacterium]